MRTQFLKATQEISEQIGELKVQVSRLEHRRGDSAGVRGAFARFRAQVLGTAPRKGIPHVSPRRKLPRR
jgi:hypothetical protein